MSATDRLNIVNEIRQCSDIEQVKKWAIGWFSLANIREGMIERQSVTIKNLHQRIEDCTQRSDLADKRIEDAENMLLLTSKVIDFMEGIKDELRLIIPPTVHDEVEDYET